MKKRGDSTPDHDGMCSMLRNDNQMMSIVMSDLRGSIGLRGKKLSEAEEMDFQCVFLLKKPLSPYSRHKL